MPLNTAEALSLVSQICEEEKLRVAIKESMKGGFIAGGTTMLGGLLGGPIGLAVGGTVGGLTAAYLSQGKFKSVASIISNDLTPMQREHLANSVRMFLRNRSIGDLTQASRILLSPSLKLILIQTVIQFLIAAIGIIFRWNRERHYRLASPDRLDSASRM
ncbi:protein C19orf12 homolog isoform X1 [Penaeus chinensis]|uniref:protein C19orf12 homolog isoform X1 n=1 Tax=Penaeus chinensis TaxID=139456 RepID=UPI001FB598B8|nr:protein C19orf12 homolog isoform X1 [Penaeus chinensis]XP_047487655.1 protein C19orf12 homolog isoform X1 [Penaeus chinensis]XP_047487656.1 protein C19orf12 homolog isoform X1 [Penaeus chinensis]XP_047487657.1 protein C19orf12 homolog isoform X1 [Penaeus chinensis]